MTKTEQDIFFALLRSAIWEKPVEMEYIKGKEYSWLNILQAFADHAILGVVANAVMHLPEEYLPEDELQQEILQYASDTKKLNEEFDTAVVESFELLQKNGLHPVLLKGQGLSALYPNTCYRSCGDIDIFIGEKDCEKAYRLIENYCGVSHIDDIYKDGQPHCKPIKKGYISFELHHHACDAVFARDTERMNKYFYDIYEKCLFSYVDIKGNKIPVFQEDANVIYVFNHFFEHFVHKGCGFRQLLDCFVLIKKENFSSELKYQMQNLGIFKPWQIFGGIFVEQFGFAKVHFPYYDDKKARKSQGKLLDFIITIGNFGRFRHSEVVRGSTGSRRWCYYLCDETIYNRVIFELYPLLAFKREFAYIFYGIKKVVLRFI